MNLIGRYAAKLAGKDENFISSDLPFSYLLRLCFRYGFRMLHGFMLMPFLKRHGKKLFVGRRVSLLVRRRISIGESVVLAAHCKIDALSRDGVCLGDFVHLGENTAIECTGGLSHIGKGVSIGSGSCFGSNCYFGAAGGIEIGRDVIAGQYVRFHSENHGFDRLDMTIREQGTSHQGIKIGGNCWIGAGAVFLDGASLGDGCVVGANAVITCGFPENSVIAGVPAKLIRFRGAKRRPAESGDEAGRPSAGNP